MLSQILNEFLQTIYVNENNINYNLKFVTVIENINFEDWMVGGEFLLVNITTLDSLGKNLDELIEDIYRYKGVGLAVKGYISREILSLSIEKCKKLGISLYLIPNEIIYLNIMDAINRTIYKNKKEQEDANNLVQSLLVSNNGINFQYEKYLNYVDSFVIIKTSLENENMDISSYENIEGNIKVITSLFRNKFKTIPNLNIYYTQVFNDITFLIFFRKSEVSEEFIDSVIIVELFNLIHTNLNQFDFLFICQTNFNSITKVYESGKLIDQAMLVVKKLNFEKNIIYKYEELKLYLIFFENSFLRETSEIKVLTKELKKHNVLFDTLEVFLKNDEKFNETSQELFIHVNSLRYRLNRIYEITNLDYRKSFDKIFLGIILIIGKMEDEEN